MRAVGPAVANQRWLRHQIAADDDGIAIDPGRGWHELPVSSGNFKACEFSALGHQAFGLMAHGFEPHADGRALGRRLAENGAGIANRFAIG